MLKDFYAMLRDVEEKYRQSVKLNENFDDERQIALVEIENQREKIKAGLMKSRLTVIYAVNFASVSFAFREVKVTRSITTIRYAKAEELRGIGRAFGI